MSTALLARIKQLESLVAELTKRVESLEQKPKVGRPPKDTNDDAGRKAGRSD